LSAQADNIRQAKTPAVIMRPALTNFFSQISRSFLRTLLHLISLSF